MITFATLEKEYVEKLDHLYGEDESKAIFLMTLEDVAGISRTQYQLQKQQELTETLYSALETVLERLLHSEPIQHILGKTDFYGLTFAVTSSTLIPRPETEELVDLIIQEKKRNAPPHLIDIGTGSGCIAISLARKLPDTQVWAMDISAGAIAVAKANAERHEQRINFLLADILEWDLVFDQHQLFDIIVSNPPYITPAEKEQMHSNVLDFEPHQALFVEEEAPLLFYDYIADFALQHLTATGCLYFEINQYLGKETASLLRKKGFGEVDIIQDINQVDRIIRAKR